MRDLRLRGVPTMDMISTGPQSIANAASLPHVGKNEVLRQLFGEVPDLAHDTKLHNTKHNADHNTINNPNPLRDLFG